MNEGVQNRGQEHEVVRPARVAPGNPDQPWQRARCTNQGQSGIAAEGVGAIEFDGEIERFVENARKWMRRVQSKRRQHRHQFPAEMAVQPTMLAPIPLRAFQDPDLLAFQFRHQLLVQDPVLLVNQLAGRLADCFQGLNRRHAIGSGLAGAVLHALPDRCDPDFEELVEVGAGNAQEADSLEQRDLRIACQFEHTPSEAQQAQLAVEEQSRIVQFIFEPALQRRCSLRDPVGRTVGRAISEPIGRTVGHGMQPPGARAIGHQTRSEKR